MTLIGTSVEVLAGSGRVLIVDTHTGEVVADHGAVAPGDSSVMDEHYGGARPMPRRAIRPRTLRRNSSAAWVSRRRRSWPVPPHPVTPGSGPSSVS